MTAFGGGLSSGTVAVNFGAVGAAGDQLVNSAGAISGVLGDLDRALSPVRESWYNSGSSSGAQAQIAEQNLRAALTEMSTIIQNLGGLLKTSAAEAAQLDSSLGNRFQVG
ncbi:WXG100 family type VII secretion target [Plantactinospora soyae]|uniref:Uncharacterized protein YukE n=1 Tax=Plantactinospora soyae TaxID=1544732 RepID=A0A927M2L6_9ACTN|nr:hypothetical protein [Plantactinospora soyae]MBE1485526.1 uncharacterized protein YukE [Plantactinospora soyae]